MNRASAFGVYHSTNKGETGQQVQKITLLIKGVTLYWKGGEIVLSFKRGGYTNKDIEELADIIRKGWDTVNCNRQCENCSKRIICNDLTLLLDYLSKCSGLIYEHRK